MVPALALVGPTGVGKTEISLLLAEKLQGEIISGDSMQVYKGMDIGTAKVTPPEQARVPHHLLDLREPNEAFSVVEYQQLARHAMEDIFRRGKLPLVVGGTGFYLRAALTPYTFSPTQYHPLYREELHRRGATEGSEVLHGELALVDPLSATKYHPNDLRRIIRALEVYHHSGVPLSRQEEATKAAPPLYNCLWLGLERSREELYRRIEVRVEAMMQAGLLQEVTELYHRYWQGELRDSPLGSARQALGYKELIPYLEGRLSLEEAVATLKQETRRFAKRQIIWFRRDTEINWFTVSNTEAPEEVVARLMERIKVWQQVT
ncbi:MAG: tRNA (adenosine(37)-N6)-dimethylallyltransferase MiaA [Symbiobacteriaceae bacterium]|nr:tRNA (adenosine(37)-N6)-dimethylallyltransferase MiaA [Symbiobacteriaceae bacterium]